LPRQRGCRSLLSILSAMSPGRITVHAMMAAIVLSGPAMPSTAPAISCSRDSFCDGDAADSSVCGSSSRTPSGRSCSPVVVVITLPRMPSPVRPATPMIDPDVGTMPSERKGQSFGQFAGGGTVGRMMRPWLHSIFVGSPPQICPLARWAMPPSRFTAWAISGKS
jgi:hypothetical protein